MGYIPPSLRIHKYVNVDCFKGYESA